MKQPHHHINSVIFKGDRPLPGSHPFLNFARKIAQATSMRRPVDIQLGLARGSTVVAVREKQQHALQKIKWLLPNLLSVNRREAALWRQPFTALMSYLQPPNRKGITNDEKLCQDKLEQLIKDVLSHIDAKQDSSDLNELRPRLIAFLDAKEREEGDEKEEEEEELEPL
ncbi:hypothetical protein PHYBLDRAFT_59703 [Phycomyces blakesleeanus NRRL 1555(-)]|uniref:Uncharacterized protein n=1 Tax=Phycomyces blakesleeanus (strain ATCC 8743b / DSM 1359 / FGSC 10004 / NBRC 33097 / NRRL 1555) TaxID=763407 RepID=A0A162PUQ7_PHYB8|nr:hypothetical protein PHYBLDRAFT_59703 [Phycomyces blakesleeanus NRRL 1555(-)]OAD76167.1 hypothetical protein PHYBLDRAFT_59703 [Phycomyces blakesleeanus NRRL 1555(-)]|eukprot:XP_018294207.1 hypothetical protein PHYBLDRAFT_59703 [Phycomyces blakesleeanus NRRL 1555(-)]